MKADTDNSLKASLAVIRGAQHNDAAAVAELLAALGYPSPVSRVARSIAACVASTDTAVFVAEASPRIVGVISLHSIPLFHAVGFLGRITSLVVAVDYRQRGIGGLLVAAAEEFAWAHGCIGLEVTSGDHRPDAHAFYEHLGYKLDARRFTKRDRYA